MSSSWSGYSEDDEPSKIVYYYDGSLSPGAIIVIVVIILVLIIAFALSVTCYCLDCPCPGSKHKTPWYSRIYPEHASSSEQLSEPKVVVHNPRYPILIPTNLIVPPLLRAHSEGLIPTARLSLCDNVKLRRAVSEDEIVTIELPLRETISVDIVPYNSDTAQIEVARGRGPANTAVSPALLNTDKGSEVIRSSPINEEVIIHHDRTAQSRGVSPISALGEVKNGKPCSRGVSPISLPPPLHSPNIDRKHAYRMRPSLSIRPVRHELDIRPVSSFDEVLQDMEARCVRYPTPATLTNSGHPTPATLTNSGYPTPDTLTNSRYPTPDTLTNSKRPALRKQRTLPQNDLIWSDEFTELDEARRNKGKQKFSKPPEIVPEHLQGRDVEWTDSVLADQYEDPTDVDELQTSNHVFESSDDEFHSTHSDVSLDDSPGPISENSGKSGPILSENSGKSDPILSENSGKPDPILSKNVDKSDPVLSKKSAKSGSSLSENSGSSGHSVTVPTKHLVL